MNYATFETAKPFPRALSVHHVYLGAAHMEKHDPEMQAVYKKVGREMEDMVLKKKSIHLLPIQVIKFEEIPTALDGLFKGHTKGKIVAKLM